MNMRRTVVLSIIASCILLSTAAFAMLVGAPQWMTVSSDVTTIESGGIVKMSACWDMNKGIRAAALDVSMDQLNYTNINNTPDWSASFYGPAMIQCNLTTFAFNTSGYYGTVYWGIRGIFIDIPVNSTNFTANSPGTAGVLKVTDSKAPAWSEQKQEKDNLGPNQTNRLSTRFTDNVGIAKATLLTKENSTWKEKASKEYVNDYMNITVKDVISQGTDKFTSTGYITSSTDCDPVTGCNYISQGFIPNETSLTLVEIKLTSGGNGNIILGIYPDNSSGYPDMTKGALATSTVSTSQIISSTFTKFDFPSVNIEKGRMYHIVLKGDMNTKTSAIAHAQIYQESNFTFSKDGGKTWKASTSDINFITYAEKTIPKSYSREVNAVFDLNGLAGVNEWKIIATDAAGNTAETAVMSFTVSSGCGACPNCTEWGGCTAAAGSHDGTMERVCYKCGADTNYLCKPSTETQACSITFIKEDADAAIADARQAIDAAIQRNLDVTEAEALLKGTQDSYSNSDWQTAVTKANEAKAAAEAAQSLPFEINWGMLTGLIMIAIVAAFGILVYTKKIDIKKLTEKLTASVSSLTKNIKLPEKKKKEEKAKKCVVCGKTITEGYKCKECGKDVCYDDARTYEGEVYDVKCLKKKGVI